MHGRSVWPKGSLSCNVKQRKIRMTDLSDKELLDALGVDAEPKKKAKLTPREERILAGFEDIQRFVAKHGRLPEHGEDKDIFERLYATRLERIRSQVECREIAEAIDHQGLLGEEPKVDETHAEMDDAALLAELGVDAEPIGSVSE